MGDRRRWYDQTGLPGWFDDTIDAARPAAEAAAQRAIDQMADRIELKAR